jgi:trigger factor
MMMSEETKDENKQEQPELPENQYAVEEAGALKRKIVVTVPRKRIDAKFEEMFGELSTSAQIPGFRVGRAPKRLVEKRFGKEVSGDVKNAMIGESLGGALEKTGLKTIGEPDIDVEKIELPESGDMTYSFEVEIVPDFELPKLEGIKVKARKVEMTEKLVDDYIEQLRQERAKFETTEEAAAEGDIVIAGAKITGEGIEPADRPGLYLRVAPGQVDGLPLVDLGKELAGKRAGETATLKVKAPDAHPNEQWREKELTVEITLSEVRHRVLAEINEEFATSAGFESLEDLKKFIRERLAQRLEHQRRQQMRDEVVKYLVDSVKFDLPETAVKRNTANVLRRRYMDLLYQGAPKEKIDENIATLQAQATEQARMNMTVSFILGKIADEKEIEVGDAEVNSRIALMASQNNRRPERLRQELEQDGSIDELLMSMREEKALDLLLEKADIEDAPAEDEDNQAKAE